VSARSSDAKEYRLRVASLPDDLKDQGGDPFAVEVKPILRRLKKDLKELGRQDLLADAQAINAVSKVVGLQDEWLTFQLTTFQVDPGLLTSKLMSLSVSDIAGALGEAHHPPAAAKLMPTSRLLEAADYWVQLYGWGSLARLGPLALADQGTDYETIRMDPQELEGRLQSTFLRVSRRLTEGPLPFKEFAGDFQGAEKLKETYSLAHLCMRGAFALRYDPSTSDYLITAADGNVDRSVAISLG
jgi:hypothetical protein